jgi:phage gp46-like protein
MVALRVMRHKQMAQVVLVAAAYLVAEVGVQDLIAQQGVLAYLAVVAGAVQVVMLVLAVLAVLAILKYGSIHNESRKS